MALAPLSRLSEDVSSPLRFKLPYSCVKCLTLACRLLPAIRAIQLFTTKGNVVDTAIGIVIGGVFGKFVSSFVAEVLMPPIGILPGSVEFSDLTITRMAASARQRGNSADRNSACFSGAIVAINNHVLKG